MIMNFKESRPSNHRNPTQSWPVLKLPEPKGYASSGDYHRVKNT